MAHTFKRHIVQAKNYCNCEHADTLRTVLEEVQRRSLWENTAHKPSSVPDADVYYIVSQALRDDADSCKRLREDTCGHGPGPVSECETCDQEVGK